MLIFGRIYVSKEGINAQVSIPQQSWDLFLLQISEIKELIINIIKSICGNLPCPDCSEHASKTLNNIHTRLNKAK